MSRSVLRAFALTLTCSIPLALFAELPKAMITHNETDLITNAFVDGTPGPNPAMPHSTSRVPWNVVKIGCKRHKDGICPAVIMVGFDTDSPMDIGTLYVDVNTGMVTPSEISANGFRVFVNGPGEITITDSSTDWWITQE